MTALDERPPSPRTPALTGATLWLTGLPSAGKTTLASALAARLRGQGRTGVGLPDGDEVRAFLSKGLGFCCEDRDTNVLRIGWVAATLARHGLHEAPTQPGAVVRTHKQDLAASVDQLVALLVERGLA